MSYGLIDDLKKKALPVSHVCRLLGVSRSGYYSATKSSLATPKICATSVHLKAAFAASGCTYGSRKASLSASPGAQPDASQPTALTLEAKVHPHDR